MQRVGARQGNHIPVSQGSGKANVHIEIYGGIVNPAVETSGIARREKEKGHTGEPRGNQSEKKKGRPHKETNAGTSSAQRAGGRRGNHRKTRVR